MADILSQDEINALLSATEGDRAKVRAVQLDTLKKRVGSLLSAAGLSRQKITAVWKRIATVLNGGGKRRSKAAGVLQQVCDALEGKGVSPEEVAGALGRALEAVLPADRLRDAAHQRIVTTYDFKHPARVNKDQLRALENLHDNFARLLSSTLSRATRAAVKVDTAFVDQTTYAEFIMSLSNPSCSYQFTLGTTNGQAVVDVAIPLVFALVDRVFGGKGSPQGVEPRQLTPIEIGEMNRVCARMVQDLEATWAPILHTEISDTELETNPEFLQITAASEIVILLAFEVSSANAAGLVSLCYPFFTLESILPRLFQGTYVRQNRLDKEELARQNLQRLGKTSLPLRAELGRTQLSLAQVRGLRPGDVVCTDARRGDPAVVYVGEEPKYLARPFATEDGRQMLRVAGVIPPEEEEIYRNRGRPVHTWQELR